MRQKLRVLASLAFVSAFISILFLMKDSLWKPIAQQKPIAKTPNHSDIDADKLELIRELEADSSFCAATHTQTNGYIDLKGLSFLGNEGKPQPWTVRGYDSGHNYTLGVCSSPFKKHHDQQLEMEDMLKDEAIGAYFYDTKINKYVSMGEFSTQPEFKGRKLTLTYEKGSYCDGLVSKLTGETLRRSTVITFTCDRSLKSKASVSFVGSFHDCNYIFEVRSHHACPTAPKENNFAVVLIVLLILFASIVGYFGSQILYKLLKKQDTVKLSV